MFEESGFLMIKNHLYLALCKLSQKLPFYLKFENSTKV